MEYRIAILSADAVFARMLEVEFSIMGLQVLSSSALSESDSADVILVDLDSSDPPDFFDGKTIIGFTRNSALTRVDIHRHCSMILHRPFEMRLLRQEVMTALGLTTPRVFQEVQREEDSQSILLDEERSLLLIGEREISLTPIEARLLKCLLEHRGETVAKETLAELIGESSANKTEVYICYLRKKTDRPNGIRLIRTVRQRGYRID